MDELDVGGKRYISSKRGAELTGYAKDYIGQLARAGKVPGTRFGRAWFVEEAALLKHLGAEMTQTEEVVVAPPSSNVAVSSMALNPVQAKKPLLSRHMITPAALPKTWSSVQYLHDDSDLFPAVSPHVVDVPIAPTPSPMSAVGEKKESEVRVPIHVAPSAVAVDKRVALLVDGIRPRSAILRVAQASVMPTPKAPEIKKEANKSVAPLRRSVPVRWSPGSFVNAVAVSIVVFGSLLSFSFMKNLSVGSTEVLTASSIYGLTDFLELLKNARIFDAGMETIRSFYTMLVESFSLYLKTGLTFILELL